MLWLRHLWDFLIFLASCVRLLKLDFKKRSIYSSGPRQKKIQEILTLSKRNRKGLKGQKDKCSKGNRCDSLCVLRLFETFWGTIDFAIQTLRSLRSSLRILSDRIDLLDLLDLLDLAESKSIRVSSPHITCTTRALHIPHTTNPHPQSPDSVMNLVRSNLVRISV